MNLEDYTISENQIKCLSESFQFFKSSDFKKIIFINNGMKDCQFANFFDGLLNN
jgi:hypothetical protein